MIFTSSVILRKFPCQNLGQDLMGNFETEIFCELARTYEIS